MLKLDRHQLNVVAGTATVAPATVERFIRRDCKMRPITTQAIEVAIRRVLKVDPETVRVPVVPAAVA